MLCFLSVDSACLLVLMIIVDCNQVCHVKLQVHSILNCITDHNCHLFACLNVSNSEFQCSLNFWSRLCVLLTGMYFYFVTQQLNHLFSWVYN